MRWWGTFRRGNKFEYGAVLRRSTRTEHLQHGRSRAIRGASASAGREHALPAATGDSLQDAERERSRPALYAVGLDLACTTKRQWASVDRVVHHARGTTTSGIGGARTRARWGSTDHERPGEPEPAYRSPRLGTDRRARTSRLPKLAGLDVVTSYRGAFDLRRALPSKAQQWTANWTNFDPQNANYEVLGVTGVEEGSCFRSSGRVQA